MSDLAPILSAGQAGEEPSRQEVWRMFDQIAPRYDLLNRLLSFGLDVRWRKRMAAFLPAGEAQVLLDLATGTADQLLYLIDDTGSLSRGTGIDVSEGMLELGRSKVARHGLSDRIELKAGDAMKIPEPDDTYDVVTISFGIRNVVEVPDALAEMRRVLKPGGRALILEFSMPANRVIRSFHLFYLRHVLPRVGGWVSGSPAAYRYLNRTIETFPHGVAFCRLMEGAGFSGVRANPLTFGVSSIYQGDNNG